MDEGAVVAWPERFNYDERSAIQLAMDAGQSSRKRTMASTWKDQWPAEENGMRIVTPKDVHLVRPDRHHVFER